MNIMDALKRTHHLLEDMKIPGSESEKMTEAKQLIHGVETAIINLPKETEEDKHED